MRRIAPVSYSKIYARSFCSTLILSNPCFISNTLHSLLPEPLQLPQHHQICIQKSIDALSHTRLLIFVQLRILNIPGGYTFAEAYIGEGVYRCTAERISKNSSYDIELSLEGNIPSDYKCDGRSGAEEDLHDCILAF